MLKSLKKLAGSKRVQLSIVASVIAAGSVLPTVAQAIRFQDISQVYFFGDSLTDSGFNNNIFTALGAGALVNLKIPALVNGAGSGPGNNYVGYMWSQYVTRDIKNAQNNGAFNLPRPGVTLDTFTNNTTPMAPAPALPVLTPTLQGVNYAAAGSTTFSTGLPTGTADLFVYAPSLHAQVGRYLSSLPANTTLDPSAVYFIWSGANDILKALSTDPSTENLLETIYQAAENIGREVATLSAKGAKRIVVMSLPNLGKTPLARGLEILKPGTIASLKNLSFQYDSFINQRLGEVIAQYHTKVLYINTYKLIDDAVAASQNGVPIVVNGTPFTFTNTTDQLCLTAPAAASSLTCHSHPSNGYMFADSVHPTDLTHQAIAAYVEQQILNWNA